MSVVQINLFIPSPFHSTSNSRSLRFSLKIFNWSLHAGGTRSRCRRLCIPQCNWKWIPILLTRITRVSESSWSTDSEVEKVAWLVWLHVEYLVRNVLSVLPSRRRMLAAVWGLLPPHSWSAIIFLRAHTCHDS